MLNTIIAIAMVASTILIYIIMVKVYRLLKSPFFIPVLTTSFLLVVMLLTLHIPYQTYMVGGKYIDLLLGPAVVALAYPLYKQKGILLKNLMPIVSGVTVGSVVGMMSGFWLAKVFGVEKTLILTLLPKSVTTPVAMEISNVLGGNASLTVVFVMIAGFTGVVIGPYILKGFNLDDEMSQGIALGSASHAIGTSKAFEYGLDAATVSSVAMTLSAIIASILGPLIVAVF